jgi:hypothetical protein
LNAFCDPDVDHKKKTAKVEPTKQQGETTVKPGQEVKPIISSAQ